MRILISFLEKSRVNSLVNVRPMVPRSPPDSQGTGPTKDCVYVRTHLRTSGWVLGWPESRKHCH
jgi:hypothetical protein